MLAGMTHGEYIKWVAIYETEPFPEERADRRNASLMINIRRALGDKSGELKDFLPDWWGEREPRQQTPEEMKANMEIIKSASKPTKPKKPKK